MRHRAPVGKSIPGGDINPDQRIVNSAGSGRRPSRRPDRRPCPVSKAIATRGRAQMKRVPSRSLMSQSWPRIEGGRHGEAACRPCCRPSRRGRGGAPPPTIARPSVRPPHLSSLMLTMSKRPTSGSMSASRLHALVRGDRDRAAEAIELRLAPARERLFDELDLAGDEVRHQRREARRREALVGVDAHPGVGPRLAHGAHALGVERHLARELQLQRLRLGVLDALSPPSPPDRSPGW